MIHSAATPPLALGSSTSFCHSPLVDVVDGSRRVDDTTISAFNGIKINKSRPSSIRSIVSDSHRSGLGGLDGGDIDSSGLNNPGFNSQGLVRPEASSHKILSPPIDKASNQQHPPKVLANFINSEELTPRQKVVREIYLTEANYLEKLQVLINVYVQPLRLDARGISPTLSVSEVHALFSDVEAVVRISERALGDMKQLLEAGTLDDCVGPMFCELAPLFKLYTSYVNSHHRALEMHRTLLLRSGYHAFCERCKELPEATGYSLDSFLILPVQRVPRYELLLRELLKHTDSEHPEFSVLTDALAKVASVASIINDNLRDHEQRSAVLGVQAKFGNSVQLVTPTRWFVRDATMRKVCKRKVKRVYFCLFNDAIIYGSAASVANSVASIVSAASLHRLSIGGHNFVSNSPVSCHSDQSPFGSGAPNKGPLYKLHRLIELMDAEASACEDSAAGEPQFLVSSALKSFKAIADSVQQRDQWVTDLKANIAEARRVRSTRENVLPNAGGVGISGGIHGHLDHTAISSGSGRPRPASFSASLGKLNLACRSSLGSFTSTSSLSLSMKHHKTEHAPVRHNGADVGNCSLCTTEFSFLIRRHQCRRCGVIICDKCSLHRWRLRNKLKRICHKCFTNLTNRLPSWDQQMGCDAPLKLDSMPQSPVIGARHERMPIVLSPTMFEKAFGSENDNQFPVSCTSSNSANFNVDRSIHCSNRSLSMDKYASATWLAMKGSFTSMSTSSTDDGSAFGESASFTSSRNGSSLSMSDIAAEVLPLRDGWRAVKDGEGKTYYFSVITQEVTWDCPAFRPPPLPPKKKPPPLPPKPAVAPVSLQKHDTENKAPAVPRQRLSFPNQKPCNEDCSDVGMNEDSIAMMSSSSSSSSSCLELEQSPWDEDNLENTIRTGNGNLTNCALCKDHVLMSKSMPPPLPLRRPLGF